MFTKRLFVFQRIWYPWYPHLTSDGKWRFTFHRWNHRECHRSSTKAGHRSHTACDLIVPVCWRFSAAVAVKCERNVWAQNRSGVWCCCNNDKIYTWNDGLQTVHSRIWCIYLLWWARLFNSMGLKPFRSSWNTGGNTPGIDWDLCKRGTCLEVAFPGYHWNWQEKRCRENFVLKYTANLMIVFSCVCMD